MTVDFEVRYRADPDPWATLTDPAEQHKIDRVVAALGDEPLGDVCELGAGIGALTARLAPRAAGVLALDAAPTAVAAATARLAPWPHARAAIATLPGDLPAGPYDTVVASEVLYYLGPADVGRVGAWVQRVLRPGGRLAAVHWLGRAPDLQGSADAVHAALARVPGLVRQHSERAPTWRLDVLRRA